LALSGIRMGLILYLANIVWKTVQEVLEDISMEQQYYKQQQMQQQQQSPFENDDEAAAVNALAFTKEQVGVALGYIAHVQQLFAVEAANPVRSGSTNVTKTTTTTTTTSTTTEASPATLTKTASSHHRSSLSLPPPPPATPPPAMPAIPLPSLHALIEKLHAAGLELYSKEREEEEEHDFDDKVDVDDRPSIQSILQSLTRAEVSILTQSLWIPPSSPSSSSFGNKMMMSSSQRRRSNTYSAAKNHPAWNKIAGLHHIKQGLLSALDMALYNNNNNNNNNNSNNSNNQRHNPTSTTTTTRQHLSPYHQHYAHLFDDDPYSPVGILLYGYPGCGKTCLVRTLAQAARLPCLVVTPSLLLRKYVGDSNLQVRTLMSLVQKLSPCILCIDEMDGLFRERGNASQEHEASRELKTVRVTYEDVRAWGFFAPFLFRRPRFSDASILTENAVVTYIHSLI
jgi:ATPase family associated with various cellular activities (AAA)